MPHVHVSALGAVVTALEVIVIFGFLNLLALRFKGHPLADAWLDIYGSGSPAA